MRTEFFAPVKSGDFHIVAEVHEAHVEYLCYYCCYINDMGVVEYDNKNDPDGWNTTSLAEAQVYLSGSIKWDGCANLRFDAQDGCMLHFCGRNDAARVGKLFDLLYDLTEQLLPTYDKELGEY